MTSSMIFNVPEKRTISENMSSFLFFIYIILQGMNVDEETIILVLSTHSRKQRQEIADEYKTQQRKVGIGDIARIYKISYSKPTDNGLLQIFSFLI